AMSISSSQCDLRVNGEMNGSCEEEMEVCENVPPHDTIIAAKSLTSDVMSDDISENSLLDNTSNCSNDFNNAENNIDDGRGEEMKVPNSEQLSETERFKELGTEVPREDEDILDNDDELEDEGEIENEDEIEDEVEIENEDELLNEPESKNDEFKEVSGSNTEDVEDCELDDNEPQEENDVDDCEDPLIGDEPMEIDDKVELTIENNTSKSREPDAESSDEDQEMSEVRSNELLNGGNKDTGKVDAKNVELRGEGNSERSDSANAVNSSKEAGIDSGEDASEENSANQESKSTLKDSDGLKEDEKNSKKKTKDGDSVSPDIEEISNDSVKSTKSPVKNESSEGNNESTTSEKDDDVNKRDGEGDVSDSKSGESPGKIKKSRKSTTVLNVTPRRSSRNLNKSQKSYVEKEDDPDIEEITPEDPLADTMNADPFRDDKENSKTRNSRKTTIVVNDTKRLVEIATGAKNMKGGKKEPTLVIIDTNSILSGRGPVPVSTPQGPTQAPVPSPSSSGYSVLPVAVPAQGMYPSHTSVHLKSPAVQAPPPPPKPPQILPTLTDDMYVVEAPSFIVPYVYEKPPLKPLQEFIEKLGKEIEEMKEKERLEREEMERLEKIEKEKEEKEKEEKGEKEKEEKEEKEKEEKEEIEKEEKEEKEKEEKEENEDEKEKEEKEEDEEIDDEKEEKGEDKGKKDIDSKDNDNASNKDESLLVKASDDKDEKTDDKSSKADDDSSQDSSDKKENKTENESGDTEKDKAKGKEDESETKSSEGKPDDKKDENNKTGPETRSSTSEKDPKPEDKANKPLTYFDNPLGKFFMQIGYNLVQEYVQTDLLRSQKRKRDRDGGKAGAVAQFAINSLLKNLELSKENNEPFHLEQKKCEYCSFKTESSLVMAQHLETPHMRNYVYRCNFCPLEVRSPHDILFHMEAEHNVRGRLERAPAFHQCPNCPFEDNQKGKLTRHLLSCAKKHKPERNQEPPPDWEPPAKIPRVSRSRPASLGIGAAAYQAMAGKQSSQTQHHPLLPKLVPAPTLQAPGMGRGRGRPPIHARYMPDMKVPQQRGVVPTNIRQNMMYRPQSTAQQQQQQQQQQMLLPTTYQIAGNQIYQSANNKNPAAKLLQQPSISITPLPRQPTGIAPGNPAHAKHGNQSGGKATFVICEICDGYIKDLEQLRNHMQWIHKVKIHPKMIYNRPPLNCQKCQFRFFTDQGLERHLLGSHGLVTSSMQEAANKGKDGGRCPVCGRVYQWKLLNHVARDHNMTLKPAHLSYKCTVCTATFGMYKQFENHVYSAHSVVAKRVMDKKSPQVPRSSQQNDAILKPLKINDEITIIPQPARPRPGPASLKERL
ncbi:hypothetical protein L9F63_007287, partial [Diploptera punctata]